MRFLLPLALALLTFTVAPLSAGPIPKEELEQQQDAFKRWWDDDLVLSLTDLPTEGGVPDFRVPYSGHDYPDKIGGTIDAMAKYDRAFHGGVPKCTAWEKEDVNYHRNARGRVTSTGRRGLFGRRSAVPGWYGHCNGWTAATIRHAEPQQSVVRNGVSFSPADIKGLLAEIYMYSDSEFLGGIDPAINPATLHLVLANWVGRGAHPVGMESAMGEVVINFPLYKYRTKLSKLSDRQYEAQTTVTYSVNTPREYDKGPDLRRDMFLHYSLDLDSEGRIVGGQYYRDSYQIDMLWTPLQPVQGGEEGNKRGNPHLSVKEVLAIWRESVSAEIRKKWLNINPTEEDRVILDEEMVAGSDTPAAKEAPAGDSPAGEAKPAAAADATPAKPATPAPAEPARPASGD